MKKVFLLIGFLAMFFLIGTAGASDLGTISFDQIVQRCAVGLVVFLLSMGAAMRLEQYQTKKERRK